MSGDVMLLREVRVQYGPPAEAPRAIAGDEEAVAFLRERIGLEAREHFVAVYLDGRHRAIAWQVVSIGTATASLVHPREVFQAAVMVGACAILLAHNHPSGDPTPSREDDEVTRRLARAGETLGIRLLDHLVIGHTSHTSYRRLGRLEDPR